ncbi:MAG: hypothetical protein Q9201_005929 [Fulgogasparrea decipioides]
MSEIRLKSIKLTGYLEDLLKRRRLRNDADESTKLYDIITPSDPEQRGAQLSIRLRLGLLGEVMAELEEQGVVVDERQPDVIRVAPAPLYNTFSDVWEFVNIFQTACIKVDQGQACGGDGPAALAGVGKKGWSHIS